MAMFDDPTTMGLLGMSQAFGQAAMPTSRPIGLGAAIGMGMGGLMQGAQAGQQMQLGQQQLEAAQLANQMTTMRMPAYQRMGQRMFGGPGAAMPGSLAGPLMPSAGGAIQSQSLPPPGQAAQPQSTGGAPLMSPADLYDRGDTAMFLGQDRASSSLYSNAQAEAGGTGYQAMSNGTSIATPGGPNDPRVAGNLKFNEALGTAQGGFGTGQTVADAAMAREAAIARLRGGIDTSVHATNSAVDTGALFTRGQNENTLTGDRPTTFTPGAVVGTPNSMRGGGAISPSAFVQAINGSESGGNPNETNPRSSATGPAQFTDSTFLPLFRQAFPAMADLSDAQALRMRTMPGVSDAMTAANAQRNAGTLGSAGFQPTADNLALAHRFGAGGATALLRADPATPISDSLLGNGVLKANPELAGQTAGGVVANTRLRFGTAPVQFGPAPTSGRVPMDPDAALRQKEAEAEGPRLAALPTDINKDAADAASQLKLVARTQAALQNAGDQGLPTGKYSPMLSQAIAAAKSLGINTDAIGIKPEAVASEQLAREGMTQLTMRMMHKMFPGRITDTDINRVGVNLADYGMDPMSLQGTLDQAKAQAQYDITKASDLNGYKSTRGTLQGWEPQFYQKNGYGPQFLQGPTGSSGAAPPAAAAPAAAKQAAAQPVRVPPPEAIAFLRNKHETAAQFDAWYGPGSAAKALGQ